MFPSILSIFKLGEMINLTKVRRHFIQSPVSDLRVAEDALTFHLVRRFDQLGDSGKLYVKADANSPSSKYSGNVYCRNEK